MTIENPTDLADLLARVRRIEDERSIERTMARYGHSLDAGDEETFMDCWAEGAVLEWPISGRKDGLDAIREGFRGHSHAPEKLHKHLMVEPVIEIDGDTASVTSMFLRIDNVDGRPVIYAFGTYEDRLARCDDGVWRFIHRVPLSEGFNPDLGIVLAEDR